MSENSFRLDLKYWEPLTRATVEKLKNASAKSIALLNTIKTLRGKSPKAESYVDEKDGYALVVKAGSNISKYGELIETGDFVEKDVYEDMASVHIRRGDVLLSSTGMGTLGKACVYDSNKPALADGHVTIIRVDKTIVNPHYLADYLRVGAGAMQIERLYTGSTGLIELQPEEVDLILVDLLTGVKAQAAASRAIRKAEAVYRKSLQGAEVELHAAKRAFSKP